MSFHKVHVVNFFQLWSALPVGNWTGSFLKEHNENSRVIYSHEDYVSLVGTADVSRKRYVHNSLFKPH